MTGTDNQRLEQKLVKCTDKLLEIEGKLDKVIENIQNISRRIQESEDEFQEIRKKLGY